jgi:hypothetical protein
MRDIPIRIWDSATGTSVPAGTVRLPNNPMLRTRTTKAKPAPTIPPHACCAKAKVSPAACAYAYAYDCPIHGATRVGTSD